MYHGSLNLSDSYCGPHGKLKLDISAYSVEGASEMQILEMLSHLPTLDHLSLDPQLECKLSPKFFTPMDLSKTPVREALLPALRVLELYHPVPCTIYAALICMLESRVPSNSDNNSPSPSQFTSHKRPYLRSNNLFLSQFHRRCGRRILPCRGSVHKSENTISRIQRH